VALCRDDSSALPDNPAMPPFFRKTPISGIEAGRDHQWLADGWAKSHLPGVVLCRTFYTRPGENAT